VRRLLALALVLPALAACGSRPARIGTMQVVAAEDVWGSIASQLAGARGSVRNIVVSPATDPHSYEPTASDARAFAGAKVAIVNGIGYDDWASQLLAANPVGGRAVVDTGEVLGLGSGDNPHQWYSPASLLKIVDAIVAAYDRVDPHDAAYFAARRRLFETKALARYDTLRAEIARRFAGVPVGYSESIFEPLGSSLGLRLLTPPGFARAIAEGSEVSAADKEAVESQARHRQIAVWVFNSQNVTPEVKQVNAIARAERIPVVTVTETLFPATATFQGWQSAQLERLLAALHRSTGR
jgi:zinc/manganese transport system substrate-binding protein